jgi:hypothetical protein
VPKWRQRNGSQKIVIAVSISVRAIRRSYRAGDQKIGSDIKVIAIKKEMRQMRYMMIVKHREGQGNPPAELMQAIEKLSEEATRAGTMLGNGGLGPTATGARVRLSGGKVSVIDGPFTEAKEIIGGYAQFELPSKEAAIKAAVEFMELHKKHWPGWEGETEVRQLFGPEDFEHCPAAANRELAHAEQK